MSPLILASASPQRKTLLQGLGLTFEVVPSRVHESSCTERDPVRRAELLSQLKARDVTRQHKGCVVIGCDTLVVSSDGQLLEKPSDAEDARRMLTLQSGKTSLVHSGVTVISERGEEYSGVSTSSGRCKLAFNNNSVPSTLRFTCASKEPTILKTSKSFGNLSRTFSK